ncbi:MAG: hypothetical protein NWE98_09925 [Candidatus Bathyarchaeota archaeon]|nr:hypothetical protein [Candidatus Bathyarchaeota archaeon]
MKNSFGVLNILLHSHRVIFNMKRCTACGRKCASTLKQKIKTVANLKSNRPHQPPWGTLKTAIPT